MRSLLFTLALAHPPGSSGGGGEAMGGLPGQRIEAHVQPHRLDLDYYVEVPALRLYKEARAEGAADSGWAARKAESFRPGLRARWADAELPLTATPVEVPAQSREGNFVELHLAATAPLPGPPGTLELRLDNFAGEAGYFAVQVTLDGGLVASETTLGSVRGGSLRDNLHGAWRTGEDARRAALTLRATRPWESHTAGPLPERMAGLVGLDGLVVAGAGLVAAGVAVAGVRWLRRGR